MNREKMLLIVNPCSGRNRGRKTIDEIISGELTDIYDVTVVKTKCRGDAEHIVRSKACDFDVLACAGGDGTLNEVICGEMGLEKRLPIFYIPNGTTNDFSKVLGLPHTVRGITSMLSLSEKNFCDVGSFNDRYFICTASFGYGVNASLSTSQELKNKFGHVAYIMSALTKLTDITPYSMEIECDG